MLWHHSYCALKIFPESFQVHVIQFSGEIAYFRQDVRRCHNGTKPANDLDQQPVIVNRVLLRVVEGP
jgi:hypothetical protein